MKIAIAGAGIFGCTIAWTLAKEGHNVYLFDKKKDIMLAASGINQFRLHRGYHYPRSKETILSCVNGELEFRAKYGECVIDEPHEHYYGIAKVGSFLNASQCFKVWKECGLKYKIVHPEFIKKDAFEAVVRVEEAIFDPFKLKKLCMKKIKEYGVRLFLNREVKFRDLDGFDLVIIATYSMNNSLLIDIEKAQKNYQFELVEKPVLKLPKRFENISFVVQDGPFTCIDPLGRTGQTLIGNVARAIHHSNINKLPEVPKAYEKLINNGIVKNPSRTKIGDFLREADFYFPGIQKNAVHVGSMFTIRTVLPYREHDDARPTIVENVSGRVITVFSGKIPTCIDTANEVLAIVRKKCSK